MNRRNFLARLLAGATGAALAATVDLDKLLWVPGAKTIFLPSVQPALLGVDWAQDPDGISIRFVRQFDIKTDRPIERLDVIYGIGTIRPDLQARIFQVPLSTDGWRLVDGYCEVART